ncbi:MAG: hypothetical protein IKU59_05240 [Bacteroidales bacterium]|nr:hypothetical protein [Bacteroidales bacterium]MBR5532690.1 hypothetical protein [Bacteroidales bacterium]
MKKIKINPNILGLITIIAALSVLTATILFIFKPLISIYLLGAGGACLIFVRLFRDTEGMTLRQKRACRIELFSALMITAASWFMYKQQQEWVALILSGALLQLYASFIASREEKKQKTENKK